LPTTLSAAPFTCSLSINHLCPIEMQVSDHEDSRQPLGGSTGGESSSHNVSPSTDGASAMEDQLEILRHTGCSVAIVPRCVRNSSFTEQTIASCRFHCVNNSIPTGSAVCPSDRKSAMQAFVSGVACAPPLGHCDTASANLIKM
jgi:hypothetical protein